MSAHWVPWGVCWYLEGHSQMQGALHMWQLLWSAWESQMWEEEKNWQFYLFLNENSVLIWKTGRRSSSCHLAVERKGIWVLTLLCLEDLQPEQTHIFLWWCWDESVRSQRAARLQGLGKDTEMQSQLLCVFHTFGRFWLVSSKTQTPPQSQLTNESYDLIVWLTIISRDLCSCLGGFCVGVVKRRIA